MKSINERPKQGIVIGDGGYLIELKRRGCVNSGSGREQVGTGRGNGQEFFDFGSVAASEGVGFVGGCCGCNAAYLNELSHGVSAGAKK